MSAQPPPKPGGVAIWKHLLDSGRVPASLRAACEARDALGRSRYGRPLETGNGRDALQDCLEELLDGVAYATQAALEDGPHGYRWQGLAARLLDEAAHLRLLMTRRKRP